MQVLLSENKIEAQKIGHHWTGEVKVSVFQCFFMLLYNKDCDE